MLAHIDSQIVQIIIAVLQVIGVPVLLWIAKKSNQIHKSGKLQNFKHEALIYSIQENLSNNGFTKDYYNKLNQLMKEHNFIYKDK